MFLIEWVNLLRNLVSIYLRGNLLCTLGQGVFIPGVPLSLIALNRNRLSCLPDGVFSNVSVRYGVYLERNEISFITPQMLEIKAASPDPIVFSLSDNKIRHIRAFITSSLPEISKIYLSENEIDTIHPDAFSVNPPEYLYLRDNRLTCLSDGTFLNAQYRGGTMSGTFRLLWRG